MGRKSHAQRLNIWLNGTPVGFWETSPSRHTFTYFDEWLADEQPRPLSLSLPFKSQTEPRVGPLVSNYVDNLLPDSEMIRKRIAQHFKTEGIDPHQLLSAIGRDCVGAIELLLAGEAPDDLFPSTAICYPSLRLPRYEGTPHPSALWDSARSTRTFDYPSQGHRKKAPCCNIKAGGTNRRAARRRHISLNCRWAWLARCKRTCAHPSKTSGFARRSFRRSVCRLPSARSLR